MTMNIRVKKEYRGTIDIRSTYIEKAHKTNSSIQVTCDVLEGKSIYTPEELKHPIRIDGPFASKLADHKRKYMLHVFKWKGN